MGNDAYFLLVKMFSNLLNLIHNTENQASQKFCEKGKEMKCALFLMEWKY